MPVIDADGAAAFPAEGVLLDARAAARYRGEVEPIDPRAGHVPGALSAPTAANLDADGRFLPPDALRARFAALGIEPGTRAAAYCGSGVTAAHEVAALEIAGIDASLFPGSWSQWSNEPGGRSPWVLSRARRPTRASGPPDTAVLDGERLTRSRDRRSRDSGPAGELEELEDVDRRAVEHQVRMVREHDLSASATPPP